METNSLYYFSEAAKDLNFTKTARRLFISQQNLSNHILRLENYYDVKLFDRKPRLALTYSGEVLLAYANNFKMDEANLKNVLTDIKEKERGTLHIGCSPIRTSIAMPALAERFSREYPNVELHFYHYHTRRLCEMLLTGELDFSVSIDKIEHPNLVGTTLFSDTIYLMVSRALLKKYFGCQTDELIQKSNSGAQLKDFSSMPFINVRSTQIINDCFSDQNCIPNYIVTTDFPQFAVPNYYENMAVSIITKTVYLNLRDQVSDDILFFPLITSDKMSLHDISFIRHRRKYLSKYGQYFMNMTINYFNELDAQI